MQCSPNVSRHRSYNDSMVGMLTTFTPLIIYIYSTSSHATETSNCIQTFCFDVMTPNAVFIHKALIGSTCDFVRVSVRP